MHDLFAVTNHLVLLCTTAKHCCSYRTVYCQCNIWKQQHELCSIYAAQFIQFTIDPHIWWCSL